MQCSVEARIKIKIETSFKLHSNTTLLISGATAGLVYARNGPLQQVFHSSTVSFQNKMRTKPNGPQSDMLSGSLCWLNLHLAGTQDQFSEVLPTAMSRYTTRLHKT